MAGSFFNPLFFSYFITFAFKNVSPMPLISLLSSPNQALHNRFQTAPLPGDGLASPLSGFVNGLSYRLNGPSHLPHTRGETAEIVWMAEGASIATPEQLARVMQTMSRDSFSSAAENVRFHQKISAFFHDGFVVAIVSKKNNDAIVFNDRFGRFPLYLAVKKDGIMVSRQIFHIHQTMGPLEADRTGAAFHLMLGFQTADNTLWKEVRRIMPGCAVLLHNHVATLQQIDDALFFTPSFDGHKNDLIGQTAALLDDATIACASDDTVLSMSGGLDSRLLAASLQRQHLPFRMVSYADAQGSATTDVRFARKLAEIVGKPLEIVHLKAATHDHFTELHNLKQGLNYSGMAFLLPFLKQLPAEARVFTGDGGDKLLAPAAKIPSLHNTRQLARHILRRHAMMPAGVAAMLTETDSKELIDELELDLNGCFRHDLQTTYSLFLLRRRAFKWLFEGEDRNRWYVGHVAPIWHQPLASFLLQVPAAEKAEYRLFRDVLVHLNPGLASVSNANWAFPVTDQRRVKQLLIRQQFKYSWPLSPLLSFKKRMASRHEKLLVPQELKEWHDAWLAGWLRSRNPVPPLLSVENLFYLYSLRQGGLIG